MFRENDLLVEGLPVVVFHFARFRALLGTWWWQSGMLDYGVMPFRLRNWLYGRYWKVLAETCLDRQKLDPEFAFLARTVRLGRSFWRSLFFRVMAGSDWLRLAPGSSRDALGWAAIQEWVWRGYEIFAQVAQD